jgi:putative ABC transport system ATP-binding protein
MLPERRILDDGGMNATSVLTRVPTAPPTVGTSLVEARDLTRIWGKGDAAQIGVSGVDLDIRSGELVAVIGPSGSGKSTLGALIAGIDKPTSGSLVVNGTRIDRMKTDRLAAWRGGNVGIVFQDFHLLPTLTAVENVELALDLGTDVGRRQRRKVAIAALEQVGLAGHAKKLPAQMSGGEQQRVGIARATVTSASLIVADEPTGALDQANGHAVFELLAELARIGTTVIFITHDLNLAGAADKVVSMIDGRVESIIERGATS